MATILGHVDLDEINRQAREARPGRAILTAIAWCLVAVGWVIAKTLALLWLSAAWSFLCVREGWRKGIEGTAMAAAATERRRRREAAQAA